uniref:RING-type domain-containing protein n=1 Tax=Gallus gallus TaxID=9031 RepID=A0A8V0YMV7_CHICK
MPRRGAEFINDEHSPVWLPRYRARRVSCWLFFCLSMGWRMTTGSLSCSVPHSLLIRTMAAEQEWVCPICHDVRKDIAYAVPCHHEFCLGCILRWGKQKKSCPLCRRDMEVVQVAAWDDDEDLKFIIWPPDLNFIIWGRISSLHLLDLS